MKVISRGRKIDFVFEGLAPEDCILTFDMDRVASANHEQAELLGWMNKLRDAAAISRQPVKDGPIITVTEAMRRAPVKEMIDHFHRGGAWEMRVARAAPQNATILAIAAKRGCTYAEAEAYIAEKMLAELSE